MTRQRTRSEILREVDELAVEAVELRPDLTHEQARGMIWEHFSDLHQEYYEAPAELPREPVAKAANPTVSDVIADAVHAEADRQAWTRWPDRSVEDIRAEVWFSPEGQALYALSKARGHEDYYGARLAKSASEKDAWAILDRWRR